MYLFVAAVRLLLVVSSFFVSSRRRHTRCAVVTGVQTCALPIYLGSTEFGGRLDKRRFGAESAKRRFVAGVHHRLSHANQFTGASLILTGKRQTVARRDRGGKLVAHVECQVDRKSVV